MSDGIKILGYREYIYKEWYTGTKCLTVGDMIDRAQILLNRVKKGVQ